VYNFFLTLRGKTMRFFVVFFLLTFVYIHDAKAYLDPGTLSMVTQVVVGAVVAVITFLKIFWNNIKTFFAELKNKSSK
jgi:hypothetical protein